jgi:hypothetical protein
MNPLSEKNKTATEDLVEFPFKVTERFQTVVLLICWLLIWTTLMVDLLSNDSFYRSINFKDPFDLLVKVGFFVIAGIATLAVWFTSTTLLLNQDSIQVYKIFGLGRRTYAISQITKVQTFGMSATKTTKKKVRRFVALNFSDGNNVSFTTAAINFERLLRYLELKAIRIQIAD